MLHMLCLTVKLLIQALKLILEILYSYWKACLEYHSTLSSSVCRVWFLSFVGLVFHMYLVFALSLYSEINACCVSSGLPMLLIKERWEVLRREGWLVVCFPGCLGSQLPGARGCLGPHCILGTQLGTLGIISVCLRRGEGLTSLAALSAALQISSLCTTRIYNLFSLTPLSLKFPGTASFFFPAIFL